MMTSTTLKQSIVGLAASSLLILTACSDSAAPVQSETVDLEAIKAATHDAYVDAINSNDVEAILARLTDDVVLQAPGAPELIGQDAARSFLTGYVEAFQTEWEKTSIDFTVSGDYAFERYTYDHTDTNRETGDVITGTGKGIIIFERGDDDVWRVAIDGWSDTAAPADPETDPETIILSVYEAFRVGDTDAMIAGMSPEIVWNEAEGNPYSDLNPYIGPDAVFAGLFSRLQSEWEGWSAIPGQVVVEGDQVVVFGRYNATNVATGTFMDIPFVHHFTIVDGQVTEFQQYTDTETHVAAMTE